MQMPVFLTLFFAPVYVPLGLLTGWIETVAKANPLTYVLEAVRSMLAGDEIHVLLAFGLAAALILGFAAVISIGFGAIGTWLALRTGSGEAIQGLFPLLFVFLFLSSMNTPRDLIGVDWFRAVATANPVSYLIECVRSLIITGWNGEALALGFGIAVVIGIVATILSTISLKERLART
jgi:ABC-2 type transport system permease protein